MECDVGHGLIDDEICTFGARCEFEVRRGEPNDRLMGHIADVGCNRVGRIACLSRRCTADGARAAVDGQAGWKGR